MPDAVPAPTRDVVVVHSSDLHLDHDYTARLHGGDGTAGLVGVLAAARSASAAVVVLAGDTFDCHRLPDHLLERAAAVIATVRWPRSKTCTSSGSPTTKPCCFPASA